MFKLNLILNFMKYPLYIRILIGKFVYIKYLRIRGIKIGRRVTLLGLPIISMHADSNIEIGSGCKIVSNSIDTALGCNHKIIMRTLTKGSKIKIGKNTGVSGGTICAGSSVTLGDDCLIGANVCIVDNDFHPIDPNLRKKNNDYIIESSKAIQIGNNVFVGTNVIILKGVNIGDNSVIGAGSIVSRSIPSNVIAAGSPCVPIKKL